MVWNYKPASDAVASYNGHEVVITGTFGSFTYADTEAGTEAIYNAN